MQFKVVHDYSSSLNGFERWKAGDIVEVDETLVEALDRDSPGVLASVNAKLPAERAEKGSKNRQLSKAENRSKEGEE